MNNETRELLERCLRALSTGVSGNWFELRRDIEAALAAPAEPVYILRLGEIIEHNEVPA
jgi:hypothetical protein